MLTVLFAKIVGQLLDLAEFRIAYTGVPLHVGPGVAKLQGQRNRSEYADQSAARRCLSRIHPDAVTINLEKLALFGQAPADRRIDVGKHARDYAASREICDVCHLLTVGSLTILTDLRVIKSKPLAKPRYRRRKENRPQEITAAAFDAFAEQGFAATRVDDVARRAGVSKGLMYLYFKTKEELFKAVVRSVVVRRVDQLILEVETTKLSSEDFIRGPLLSFLKQIPGSPVAIVIRLLISEGPRHPDLVDYYYDNVVAKGLAAISGFINRGIDNKEFRRSAISDLPHLVLAPVMLSIIWGILFKNRALDTDKLIETQIDMLLAHLKA
ncbi:MAG: TetR/AcrR family transcriptional regulator [Chromatiales bacterium]|nr:MAG: TetR/AcrR family transcriptional regulator [Chromatiales bacterium]